MTEDKVKMMIVTNPDEIEAVRIGFTGKVKYPIGEIRNGVCFAYKWSVERWREFNRITAANKKGVT